MPYLLAGPFIALVGIVAVFFVFRRKAVDKRSMYSARRQQIEHKVRAARQRTLAPHGHAEKAPEAVPAGANPFEQTQAQPMINYPTPAYSAPAYAAPAAQAPAPPAPPPAAPPPTTTPTWGPPAAEPQQMPWEQPPTPAPPAAQPPPPPSTFDYPPAPAEPFRESPSEPFQPAVEPAPATLPNEPVWTPAPRPTEPEVPIREPAAASATSTGAAGGWSIVTTSKDSSVSAAPDSKARQGTISGSWQLASGEAPGAETEEADVKRPSGTLVAAAQYAVLVVGLVMVLIGVLVMVANSHVT